MLQKIEIPSTDKVLTREQKAFNKLLKDNENLKHTIIMLKKQAAEMDRLFHLYILPIQNQLFDILIKQLAALDFAFDSFKFNKKTREQLEAKILEYLETFEQFPNSVKNDFLRNMKEKYLGMEEQLSEKQSKMAREMFREKFGVDLGDDFDYDLNNPESQRKFNELLEEKMGSEKKPKAKSKLVQAAEDTLKKSLRQLYTGLVKILHPDSEQDENMKLEKTEAMKIVTEAYEKNDLPKLLSLQLQYGLLGNDKLETLAEEELSVYVKILKKQHNELQNEYIKHTHSYFNRDYIGSEREVKVKVKEMKKSFEYENSILRNLQTETGVKDFLRY